MENDDLELGKIEKSVQHLLSRVRDGDDHTNPVSPSICMVHSTLRDLSPSSFNPRMVSIGPLHREDEKVKAFEGQKATYLINLMSNMNSTQEQIIKSCTQKAYASMKRIKACYVWTKTYDDAEIVEMMVMDACFILGFLYGVVPHARSIMIFQNLITDLVLLENQIPLFFINEIFQCTILEFAPHVTLIGLLYPILVGFNLFKADININNASIDTSQHILGLIHQCYSPQDYIKSSYTCKTRSVVNLAMAGVIFKPNQDPTWPMEMKVKWSWGKPILRMPVMHIDDGTELILRNLIAYEQSCQTRRYIESYAYAMDTLVNTQEDVAKLVDSGILYNDMGSNEEVANIINSICKDVVGGDFFYTEQWKTLQICYDSYCNSYWPKHIARLKSTYFNSPWNMIALLAGIILFGLTMIQTIFTIKSA